MCRTRTLRARANSKLRRDTELRSLIATMDILHHRGNHEDIVPVKPAEQSMGSTASPQHDVGAAPLAANTIETAKQAHRRRQIVSGAACAAVTTFFGRGDSTAFGQSIPKETLLIGLTTDDTGQYSASGLDELRGIQMAINEANERGGVLGRRLETTHADTGGDPVKAAAVAQRMLAEKEVAFMLGGVHSGAASAISQVRPEVWVHLLQYQLELAERSGQGLSPHQIRLGRKRE